MRKTTYILLIIMTSVFSCKNENLEEKLTDKLIGVRWENSDLDFVGFDTALIYVPIKDMYPTTCAFEYSIKSDTLIIINKTVNAYNLKDFKDTISYLKIKTEKDSLKLELLNNGAKELFNGFENFTFYNSNTTDRYSYYKEKDTACLEQINKAKEEIKNGTFVLCIYPGWPFRQEKDVVELLKKNGIEYKDLGPPPDVLPIERNCYRETMDYYIQKRFGKTFIDSLIKEADTLMVKNNPNRTYQYYKCDNRPHLPSEKERTDDYLPSINVKQISIKKDTSFYGGWPFIDLGFTVNKDSTISDFHVRNFVPKLEVNKKYKRQLIEIAINEMNSKYQTWIPGKILDINVITDNNVRIHFTKGN